MYFASYEAVKHAMGGNDGGKHEHHPLAAGMNILAAAIFPRVTTDLVQLSAVHLRQSLAML